MTRGLAFRCYQPSYIADGFSVAIQMIVSGDGWRSLEMCNQQSRGRG